VLDSRVFKGTGKLGVLGFLSSQCGNERGALDGGCGFGSLPGCGNRHSHSQPDTDASQDKTDEERNQMKLAQNEPYLLRLSFGRRVTVQRSEYIGGAGDFTVLFSLFLPTTSAANLRLATFDIDVTPPVGTHLGFGLKHSSSRF